MSTTDVVGARPDAVNVTCPVPPCGATFVLPVVWDVQFHPDVPGPRLRSDALVEHLKYHAAHVNV